LAAPGPEGEQAKGNEDPDIYALIAAQRPLFQKIVVSAS
jgi:hypothetical protein